MKKLMIFFVCITLFSAPLLHAIELTARQETRWQTKTMSKDEYNWFMRNDPRASNSRLIGHHVPNRVSSDSSGSFIAGAACIAFIGVVACILIANKTSSHSCTTSSYHTTYYDDQPSSSYYNSSYYNDQETYTVMVPETVTHITVHDDYPQYSAPYPDEETYTVLVPETTTHVTIRP